MEPMVLNDKFELISIVDAYESFIWTDRYNDCGDFEMYFPMNISLIDIFKETNYLWLEESEHTMMIENVTIDSDTEDGSHLIVTGRSLESMLERRIIWKHKVFSGNLQDAIKTMLEENIINPSDDNRKIDNFIFVPSTDTRITSLKIEDQYLGQDLYSIIQKLCSDNKIGFKIVLNEKNQFEFSLYVGKDRSYEQNTNPYVIFSPEMDNIINSNYYSSVENYKNVVLVGGEGQGADKKTIVVGNAKGLNRREMFTESRVVSSNGSGGTLSQAEIEKQMKEYGLKTLKDFDKVTAFEGEVETNRPFLYGVDFFIGDTVQLVNEYGIEGAAYISELVISENETGKYIYPTFKMHSEKGDDI